MQLVSRQHTKNQKLISLQFFNILIYKIKIINLNTLKRWNHCYSAPNHIFSSW
jgi:hypothetical protein